MLRGFRLIRSAILCSAPPVTKATLNHRLTSAFASSTKGERRIMGI